MTEASEDWQALAARPGFLIRRLHQIHLALFAEECAAHGATPVQFSLMSVLAGVDQLDQTRLAEEVGVDRATTANVVARLERAGLLRRFRTEADGRVKQVALTEAGRDLLARMQPGARRAHDRTIAPLPPEERALFLALLRRLVAQGSGLGRAPLRLDYSATSTSTRPPRSSTR